jgi:hypothetical protein
MRSPSAIGLRFPILGGSLSAEDGGCDSTASSRGVLGAVANRVTAALEAAPAVLAMAVPVAPSRAAVLAPRAVAGAHLLSVG